MICSWQPQINFFIFPSCAGLQFTDYKVQLFAKFPCDSAINGDAFEVKVVRCSRNVEYMTVGLASLYLLGYSGMKTSGLTSKVNSIWCPATRVASPGSVWKICNSSRTTRTDPRLPPTVTASQEGATAAPQISRWLREKKRVCNLGGCRAGVKCGTGEKSKGMTKMPPVPTFHIPHSTRHSHSHSLSHSQTHSQTHSYSYSLSHWPSLHALRKLNSLGEIYAPSRLLPRKETALAAVDAREEGNAGGGEAGHSSISALCVVAFRTQRNMQQGNGNGNW